LASPPPASSIAAVKYRIQKIFSLLSLLLLSFIVTGFIYAHSSSLPFALAFHCQYPKRLFNFIVNNLTLV